MIGDFIDTIINWLRGALDYVLGWYFYFYDGLIGFFQSLTDVLVFWGQFMQSFLDWSFSLVVIYWEAAIDFFLNIFLRVQAIWRYMFEFIRYVANWIFEAFAALYGDFVLYDGNIFEYWWEILLDITYLGFSALWGGFHTILDFFGISGIGALGFLLLLLGFRTRVATQVLSTGFFVGIFTALSRIFGGIFSRFSPGGLLGAVLILALFYIAVGIVFDLIFVGIFRLVGYDGSSVGTFSGAVRSFYEGILPYEVKVSQPELIQGLVIFVVDGFSILLYTFAIREVVQLFIVAYSGRFVIDKIMPQLTFQIATG